MPLKDKENKIIECTTEDGEVGYKANTSTAKCYTNRRKALQQMRAILANE